MPASINTDILDRAIHQALLLQRYKTKLIKDVLSLLNKDVYPDLLAQIAKRLKAIEAKGFDRGPATTARLKEMSQLVRETIQANSGEMRNIIRAELRDLAKVEADRTVMAVNRLAKGAVEFTMPSAVELTTVVSQQAFGGTYVTEWLQSFEKQQQMAVLKTLRIGVAQGKTTDEIIAALRGTKEFQYTDSILNVSRNSVARFVRTAIQGVAAQAREQVYKENADVIDSVEWVSTLDTSTCPECGDLDGQTFAVDDGPRPPDPHDNCRCTTVPVLKSWEELGIKADELPESTRAAMDGEVPESVDYNEWLTRQSESVQDEALGPTRAALFRDGGLDIGDFVDDHGNLMTLDELHAHEKEAFEQAGITG